MSYASGKTHLSKKIYFTNYLSILQSQNMTENFGWAVDFILRLQSVNLLVCVTHPAQLVKEPDIERWQNETSIASA